MAMALTLGLVSFGLAIIWGGVFVRILIRLNVGKEIRVDGPQSHLSKMGTPTMGGILILVAILIVTVVANVVEIVRQREIAEAIVIPLIIMGAFGVLGAADDLAGLRGTRKAEGLLARTKFVWQILLALGAASLIHWRLGLRGVAIPTVLIQINIGVFYVPVAVFIIVAFSNAVNLVDGLDGLAGLISATAFGAYGVIAAQQNQQYLVQFCFIVMSACIAFLWFNSHPA